MARNDTYFTEYYNKVLPISLCLLRKLNGIYTDILHALLHPVSLMNKTSHNAGMGPLLYSNYRILVYNNLLSHLVPNWLCILFILNISHMFTFNLIITCNFLFQTFAVFWMFYAFFWVILRRLSFISRRFGTPCLFHLHRWIDVEWLAILHLPAYEDRTVFRNVGI
jgi:hypothetical protein